MIDLDRAEYAAMACLDPLVLPDVLAIIRELRAARAVVELMRRDLSNAPQFKHIDCDCLHCRGMAAIAAYDAAVKEQK